MSCRDLLEVLSRVLGDDLLEPALEVDRLARLDLDVGRLPLEAAPDLVDQDLRVRQRHPLPFRAAGEQQRAHAHRDPDADRLHVRLDELHRVVDREARVDRAARRVDVERDVLVRVLGLEVEQLGDDQVRDLVVDRRAEEDDPLVEQARVDVERRARRATSARSPSGSAGSCRLSLLPGVHSFVSGSGFSLSGVQSLLARLRELRRDRLDLGGEPVERLRAGAGPRAAARAARAPRRRRSARLGIVAAASACSRISSSTSSSRDLDPEPGRRPPRARARARPTARPRRAMLRLELLRRLAASPAR